MTSRVVFDHIDLNCTETQVLPEPLCNSCEHGYVFQEGVCVECQTNVQSCYSCDPLERKKCLMCNLGYRMNSKGECENDTITPNPDVTPPVPPKYAVIFRIFLMSIMVLFMW